MDRNADLEEVKHYGKLSLSARRAWIEITLRLTPSTRTKTSLSARRAWIEIFFGTRVAQNLYVALRKESVDRNFYLLLCRHLRSMSLSARRAWIEILAGRVAPTAATASLSARRAWIEICVGLRQGSTLLPSLSARRAWIEICQPPGAGRGLGVALRKESVDRNAGAIIGVSCY